MIPVQAIFELGPTLLGADTTTLALATTVKVALVKAPFTPDPSRVYGDLTLADFDGSTPKIPTPGTQPESLDPSTGDALITIVPPAGGFHWETTGVTNLPQTIYGFALYTTTGPTLFACDTFSAPIELNAVNQSIDLGPVRLRFSANGVS